MGLKRLAGVAAVAALALATTVTTASARTLVVHPGQSIQKKIDRARGGDTVIVMAATYRESLDINKGITLQGEGAVLKLGRGDSPCNRFGARTGICVHGKLRFSNGGRSVKILRHVPNVRIRGMRIRGFPGEGVFAFATRDLRLRNNRFVKNRGYGTFSLRGRGTRMVHNIAKRNGAPGLYVGDSPNAHAVLRNNRSVANRGEGILLRHASSGRVFHNVLSGNCAGLLVLADAPGPARNWTIAGNRVVANNRGCAGEPDEGEPGISGLGIALLGAQGTVVRRNVVRNHAPSTRSFAAGGIVVAPGVAGTKVKRDRVVANVVLGNRPRDITWLGGGGVRFVDNLCRSSKPRSICR